MRSWTYLSQFLRVFLPTLGPTHNLNIWIGNSRSLVIELKPMEV